MNEPSWPDLFLPAGQGQTTDSRPVWLVSKGTHPLLLLPQDARCAAEALSLYPAQRPLARLARVLLRSGIQARLPVPVKSMELRLRREDPFVRFLERVAGVTPVRFAISMGNPHAPGRRFVVLVFDAAGTPAAIVKAGVSDAACHLIEQEEAVLTSLPAHAGGAPRVRDSLRAGRVRAFATDYIAGRTARARDEKLIGNLLKGWIDGARTVGLGEMNLWKQLTAHAEWTGRLAARAIHPVLFHGDFAPWNIRITHGAERVVVLDWERGELAGIPTWDWLHFVIQTQVLAERAATSSTVAAVERLLQSKAFRDYAERASVRGLERSLVLGYLLYCMKVVRQTAGAPKLNALYRELTQRWPNV